MLIGDPEGKTLPTMWALGTLPREGNRVEMSLLGLCGICNGAPRGIDGHANLHAHSHPADGRKGRFVFRCSTCGARWSRTYTGSGEFAWVLERISQGEDAAGDLA